MNVYLHATNGIYGVKVVAFSPNSRILASADSNGNIQLWNPATTQLLHTLYATDGEVSVNGVAFSLSGRILASAGGDGNIRLWNPATGQPFGVPFGYVDAGDSVTDVTFSSNADLLALDFRGFKR